MPTEVTVFFIFSLQTSRGRRGKSGVAKLRKYVWVYIAFVFSLLFVLLFAFSAFSKEDDESSPLAVDDHVITHALGGIDGKNYTNSLEAFMHHYDKGSRVFEVDLILTEDNHLVAAHDWKKEKPLTLEQFKSRKIEGKYSPLSFEEIVHLLDKYEDVLLITDTKTKTDEEMAHVFEQIVKQTADVDEEILSRIIPQIYHPKELALVRQFYSFEEVFFTLYRTDLTDEEVLDFALKNDVKAIVMSKKRYSNAFVQLLNDNGIRAYVHTINDVDAAKEYLDAGVYGVFTDFINVDEIK